MKKQQLTATTIALGSVILSAIVGMSVLAALLATSIGNTVTARATDGLLLSDNDEYRVSELHGTFVHDDINNLEYTNIGSFKILNASNSTKDIRVYFDGETQSDTDLASEFELKVSRIDELSREELAKLLVIELNLSMNGDPVECEETSEYDQIVLSNRILSCYSDGNFHPEDMVIKQVAAKAFVVANGYTISTETTSYFEDVDSSNPFFAFIQTLVDEGIIEGGGNFNPADSMIYGDLKFWLGQEEFIVDLDKLGDSLFDTLASLEESEYKFELKTKRIFLQNENRQVNFSFNFEGQDIEQNIISYFVYQSFADPITSYDAPGPLCPSNIDYTFPIPLSFLSSQDIGEFCYIELILPDNPSFRAFDLYKKTYLYKHIETVDGSLFPRCKEDASLQIEDILVSSFYAENSGENCFDQYIETTFKGYGTDGVPIFDVNYYSKKYANQGPLIIQEPMKIN